MEKKPRLELKPIASGLFIMVSDDPAPEIKTPEDFQKLVKELMKSDVEAP